ncbi:MAG: oxidoreductase [Chitinophagales bacterium]
MNRTALLVGATGLVGSELLQLLLADNYFSSVIILSRKTINIQHQKLKEIIVDFNQLENYASEINAQYIYCCLGTTIKKAGSQEAFKKVDYEYPLAVAQIAKTNGAKNFSIITALGANKNSSIFYNRVKGEIQEALIQLNFEQLQIIQPSLLLGERSEKRFSENVGQKIAPIFNQLLIGGLKKYKAIEGKQVAKAMLFYSKQSKPKVQILTNDLLLSVK